MTIKGVIKKERLCNRFFGSSRCSKVINNGKCPGIGKGERCNSVGDGSVFKKESISSDKPYFV